jgi:transposase
MIPPLTRHAIQILLQGGRHTVEEIARLQGVSERSVFRIATEAVVTSIVDGVPPGGKRVGRPGKVEPFREAVRLLLKEEPGLLSVEVLRRMRLQGYDGGKSALYEFIASVRKRTPRLQMRFEGLPGEFSQHDFGHVHVEFLDGTEMYVHFFASRLKYSRRAAVTVVPDETAETLVRTLAAHLAEWGGSPSRCVFDRPKTIAVRWSKDGKVEQWNSIFAQAALDLGIGPELCWPHSPRQKGSVENLVGWVKGSFFKQRRFHDLADLEAQLADWLREVNELRACRETREIPMVRFQKEVQRLRPLRVSPEELTLRIPVVVDLLGNVVYLTNQYAMPPEAAGQPGTLYRCRDTVRIIVGRHEATYRRETGKHFQVSSAEVRAARLGAIHGVRGKRYLKRQDLLATGEAAYLHLTELLHRRPRTWYEDVDRLHELLQAQGPEVLAAAFAWANRENLYGAEYIAHYLTRNVTLPILAMGLPPEAPHDGI